MFHAPLLSDCIPIINFSISFDEVYFKSKLYLYYTHIQITTVKSFVLTPKITKNSIILRGGYDKGYKNFL